MPPLARAIYLALLGLSSINKVKADWQFKSRPDLAPPKLNITIPATKDVEPGYLFIPLSPDIPMEPDTVHSKLPHIFLRILVIWYGPDSPTFLFGPRTSRLPNTKGKTSFSRLKGVIMQHMDMVMDIPPF
jgi:hypothetical protein